MFIPEKIEISFGEWKNWTYNFEMETNELLYSTFFERTNLVSYRVLY